MQNNQPQSNLNCHPELVSGSRSKSGFKQTEIDLIPEDWEVLKVSEIAKINDKTVNKIYSFKNIEYLDTSSTDNGQVLEWQKLLLAEAPSRAKRIVQNNDIVISTVRPNLKHFAILNKVKDNSVVSTGYTVISPLKCDPKYLYYSLTTNEVTEHLSKIADTSTSTYPSIRPEIIANLEIKCPPFKEQQKIAEVLGALDEKIELNRKMNKTLESLGQAIFKNTFRHSGLDPESKKLCDLADISIGRTPPRKEEQWFSSDAGDIKWVSIKDMGNCGIFINKTSEYLTKEAIDKFRVPVIPKNTLILSFKLTIGRIAITEEKMVSNEAIAHIKLIDKSISNEYLFFYLKNFDYSCLGSTSSIATAVNSQTIKNINVLVPASEKIEFFSQIIRPIFEKIRTNAKEIETLSQIRDSLLPRLMSGKLRLK